MGSTKLPVVLLASLQQLEPSHLRTVVINVNSDFVAMRAVLSAVEVVGDPVLLVNCDRADSSRSAFERLQARYPLDVIEMPAGDHGATLDSLFSALRDELILLLDADAEVLDSAFVDRMRAAFGHRQTFGAGFTQGPYVLSPALGAPPGFLYMERPWMPCAMFRRSAIQEALDAGHSFKHRSEPNEIGFNRQTARLLAARFGPPWVPPSNRFARLPEWAKDRLATWQLDRLSFARRRYHGRRPTVAYFDTGAAIYNWLRFENEQLFAGIPMELIDGEVHHFAGATCCSMFGPLLLDTDERWIEAEVTVRLAGHYGYDWEATEAS